MRALIEAFQRVSRQLIEGPPPTFAHQQTRILSQAKPKGGAREAGSQSKGGRKEEKEKEKEIQKQKDLKVLASELTHLFSVLC